jgi:hypothetical protein
MITQYKKGKNMIQIIIASSLDVIYYISSYKSIAKQEILMVLYTAFMF